MLKTSAFLSCFLFIAATGTSKAEPPNSPDAVYVDGLPCNQACQSYMAWSRSVSGRPVPVAPQPIAPQPPLAEVQPTTKKTIKKAAPDRVAKENRPNVNATRPVPDAQLARVDRAGARPVAPQKPVVPQKPVAPHLAAAPPTRSESEKASEQAKTIPPVQDLTGAIPDSKPATVPDPASAAGTVTATGQAASVPTTQGQTAALPPSETPPNSTPAQPPSEEKPEKAAGADTKLPDLAKATSPDNAKTAALASSNADPLVAVLLVRTEIKSASDLANKVVAIDASDAVSRTKTAIVSAGGADVQLSEGQRMALLRVMDGEVPAAVVSLESPQQAAAWTEVPGFNVLRLPLAPASEKNGPG
jgi:hypothetical protein